MAGTGYCKVRKEFFGRCASDVPAVVHVRPLVATLAANGLVPRKDAAGAQADALMKWMMAGKGTDRPVSTIPHRALGTEEILEIRRLRMNYT